MRTSSIRDKWMNGEPVLNGWLYIPSSFSAEIMAHAGWDSLCLDLQHGMFHYETSVPMLQAVSTTGVTPIARVPWNDPAIIMKMLDAGTLGIICPMIESAAEAEQFVGACRYPPLGFRSYGPTRAMMYGGSDYTDHADKTIVTLAMIETREGLAKLDEILRVPGLDGIYIGPSDLGRSLGGRAMLDQTDPKIVAVIDDIIRRTRAAGLHVGIHTGSSSSAAAMARKGCDFVSIMSDARIFSNALDLIVKEFRNDTIA